MLISENRIAKSGMWSFPESENYDEMRSNKKEFVDSILKYMSNIVPKWKGISIYERNFSKERMICVDIIMSFSTQKREKNKSWFEIDLNKLDDYLCGVEGVDKGFIRKKKIANL